MNWILKWLEGRRLRRSRARWRAGFDYAAGYLLLSSRNGRLKFARAELEGQIDNQFDRDEFEHGMTSALATWDRIFTFKR